MNFACANGHLATVEWMHQNRIADCTGNAINLAAKEGHLAVVEWLYKHRKEGDPRKAFLRACRGGDLATCEFLFACMEESTFDTGAAAGPWGRNTVIEESPTYRRHFPKPENAEATFPQVFTTANTPFPADAEGVLTSNTQQGQSQAPAPLASVATTDATVRADRVHGPSPVETNGPVRYTDERNEDLLPNTNAEKCLFSTDTSSFGASRKLDVRATDSISIPAGAFDEAAGAGNLKVVEWLHQLGAQGTVSAMDDAALNNHFHMVEWLHYNRAEGCTKLAFDSCARTGNLEMMQWLHYHRNEGGTSDAFDMAAGNGRLTMVEFLHNCTASEATTDAMDRAARKGHLLTLAWLHRRRGEGASAQVWAGVLDDDDEDADEGGPEGWGGGLTRKDYYDCGRPNRFSGNSFRRPGVPATRRRNFSGDAEREDGVGGEEGSVLLWDSPSTLAEQQVEVIQSWLQINKPPQKG
uniref:Uncharacterized protein n=1 Tax=Heterosigma akashiwo TaxID=2829 RepID=A0A7S3Y3G9_HETAK